MVPSVLTWSNFRPIVSEIPIFISRWPLRLTVLFSLLIGVQLFSKLISTNNLQLHSSLVLTGIVRSACCPTLLLLLKLGINKTTSLILCILNLFLFFYVFENVLEENSPEHSRELVCFGNGLRRTLYGFLWKRKQRRWRILNSLYVLKNIKYFIKYYQKVN